MATLMRALLALLLVLLCLPAQAEPVSGAIAWIASAVTSTAFVATVTVLSIASTAYASNQAKKRAHNEAARKLAQDIANLSDRRVTLLQSDSPNVVVYGSPARIGGSLVGMLSSGTGNQLTHLIIIFASHECAGIDEIYIDDDPVMAGEDGWTTNEALKRAPSGALDFDNGPMVHVGIHLSPGGVDTADQWLIDQMESPMGGFPGAGLWTADHKLSGFTYAVVTVNKVMSRFQGGPPNITAKIRGKATIYDPRTGTRGYTRNPALCLADFIMSAEGYGAGLDQIDAAAWIAAANACDQEVYGPEADDDAENYGNSRALYVCDGMFRSDQNRDSTRQQIEECMAGFTLQSAGVWRLQAGAWSTPVMAMSEADMLAPIVVVQTCHPGERVYNTARGTYINAARNGVSEDFAAYRNDVFVGVDPHVKATDMTLPFTGSHMRCHQLARVAVERSRGGLVLQIHPKMMAWHLQPGDRILLSSQFYGFEEKAFIVTDWSYSRSAPLTLEVLEDVPNFYDTADEVLADAAPNTNLPNPFAQPQAPQNLQVVSGVDNLAVQGASVQVRARVTWSRSTSSYVLNGGSTRLQWRLGATDPEQPDPPDVDPWKTVDLPGDAVEAFVLGLDVGEEYTVRAQFRTAAAESAWSWAGHLLSGNTPPAEVDGLSLTVEQDGIVARWSPPEGIDLIEWDRTMVGRGDTVEEAGGDVRFNGHAVAANLGWFPVGPQTVWAIHFSRAGTWSPPVSAGITIEPPATPVIAARLQGRTVHLEWQDCRTTQPVREYILALGTTAETAVEIGRITSTSAQRVEATAEILYTYWVRAVDMAGNVGEWAHREVMTLPSFDDSTDLGAYVDRVYSLIEQFRDQMAALQIRGALQAETAVARAREKLGNDLAAQATVIDQVREQAVTDKEALASQIDTVASQFGASIAVVEESVSTLATQHSATATRLVTLVAEVEDDRAFYTQEITALVDEDQALAESLTVLSTDYSGNKATVATQLTTLSTDQSAQATQLTGLTATVGSNHSQVVNQISVLSGTQSSQASQITVISAQASRQISYRQSFAPSGSQLRVGDLWMHTGNNNLVYFWSGTAWQLTEDPRILQNTAAIASEASTRASQHDAQATQINTLIADVGFIGARYVTEAQVTANVNGAIATNNTWLQSSAGPVGSLQATVSTQQTTVATLNGNLAAQYLLKTELSGSGGKRYIAGIKVGVSSTSGGADVQSEVVVMANTFQVIPSSSSPTAVIPFKVQDGTVYIDAARIRDADIGTLKLQGRAVVQPMVTSGTGTAQIAFTVPPGQSWDCMAVAGFRGITGAHLTAGHTRAISLALSGGGTVSDTVYPVVTNVVEGEAGSTLSFALPSAALTGGGTLGAGNWTVTATSSVLGSAQGGVDLSIIVGKAGA